MTILSLSAIRFRINPFFGVFTIGKVIDMPDYASILRRSISGLTESSPDVREAVYQRARAALARQLTAVDPPLSTREIEAQHQELEDAVSRLEAEFATQEVAAPGFDNHAGKDDFLYSAPPPPEAPRPQPAPGPAEAMRGAAE